MEPTEAYFDYYFKKYYREVAWHSSTFLHDGDAAQDMAQKVFIRLWETDAITSIRKKYNPESADKVVRAWLYKSVRNASLNYLGYKKRVGDKLESIQIDEFDGETKESDIINMEFVDEIHDLIHLLPPSCREIFALMFVEGLTAKQTAKVLRLSHSTVKNQKGRGLDIIRRILATRKEQINAPKPEPKQKKLPIRPNLTEKPKPSIEDFKHINHQNAVIYHFRHQPEEMKWRELELLFGVHYSTLYARYINFVKECNEFKRLTKST